MPPTTTIHLVHQWFITKILWTPTMWGLRKQNVFSYVKMLWEMMAQLGHSNKVNDWLLCIFIIDNDNVKMV